MRFIIVARNSIGSERGATSAGTKICIRVEVTDICCLFGKQPQLLVDVEDISRWIDNGIGAEEPWEAQGFLATPWVIASDWKHLSKNDN